MIFWHKKGGKTYKIFSIESIVFCDRSRSIFFKDWRNRFDHDWSFQRSTGSIWSLSIFYKDQWYRFYHDRSFLKIKISKVCKSKDQKRRIYSPLMSEKGLMSRSFYNESVLYIFIIFIIIYYKLGVLCQLV